MIEHRYRTFWRRFWAGMFDGTVLWPLYLLNQWAYSNSLPHFLLILLYLFYRIAPYLYYVLMHGRFGQTLGKMAFKVKVVDKSEEKPITYWQALMRDVVPILIVLLIIFFDLQDVLRGVNPYQTTGEVVWPLFLLALTNLFWFWAEVITMLTNKKRRAVHDFIASSVVIRLT